MLSIENYIKTPIPIRKELLSFFDKEEQLVIFDVGACEGEDSIRYSNLFPNAKVYAFEPNPTNLERISNNLKRFNKESVTVIPEALSNVVGTSVFYVSSGSPKKTNNDNWDYGNKSSSLLPPDGELKKNYEWLNFDNQIEVKTNTIRNLCNNLNLSAIDFMHLDVQGAELMVLAGAEDFIYDIKSIWLEVESTALYKDQPLKDDVEKFMSEKGFVKIKESLDKLSGDQLYVNKRFHSRKGGKEIIARKFKSFLKRLARARVNKSEGKVSYSQSGEDLIVQFIFKGIGIEKPSYIDIGAHHPFFLSNTAIFYQKGCRGINIEPDPKLYEEFIKERKEDINLNIGIGGAEGELDFYIMSAQTLNTFSKKDAEELVNNEGYKINDIKKIKVETINQVINKYNKGVFPDFLTLDVEGVEEEILFSIDYDKGPLVICLETISFSTKREGVKDRSIIDYLTTKGYMVYADTHINTIFVKKDRWMKK